MRCKKLTNKEKETVNGAIAHLRGYAILVRNKTGYKPVAVNENIKKLKRILKNKC